MQFNIKEGDRVIRNTPAAQVDTLQLHLTKVQLEASREALVKKKPEIQAEAGIYCQQRQNLQHDIDRYRRLVKEGAVASRQLEDLENQARVIDRQIGSIAAKNPEISKEINSMDARVAQIEDQIKKSTIRNPINGIILTTYAEPGEMTAHGKPLFKIADLDSMFLRVYLSGSQLSSLKTGDEVDVLFDGKKPADQLLKGRVTWISSKAEFTPKIIQTREDRVTMVYAVKVLVSNKSGLLKIGMPGEIRFQHH